MQRLRKTFCGLKKRKEKKTENQRKKMRISMHMKILSAFLSSAQTRKKNDGIVRSVIWVHDVLWA